MGAGKDKSFANQLFGTLRRAWHFTHLKYGLLALLVVGSLIFALNGFGSTQQSPLSVYHEPLRSKAQLYSKKRIACLIVGDTFALEEQSQTDYMEAVDDLFNILQVYETYVTPFCDLKVLLVNSSIGDYLYVSNMIQQKLPNSDVAFIPRNEEKWRRARRIDHYHVMTYAYHYFDDYDWYLKLHDADALLMVDHFIPLVYDKNGDDLYDMEKPKLMGHFITTECYDFVYARTVYAFNNAFLLKVGAIASQHVENNVLQIGSNVECRKRTCQAHDDDDFAAFCLQDLGITVQPKRDSKDREYFLIWTVYRHYVSMTEWKENDWYWTGKNPQSVGSNCCADYPVAFAGYIDEVNLAQDFQKVYSVQPQQRNMNFLSKLRAADEEDK